MVLQQPTLQATLQRPREARGVDFGDNVGLHGNIRFVLVYIGFIYGLH